MDSTTQIALAYQSRFPEVLFEEFLNETRRVGLNVAVRQMEPTVMASVEWAMPTAIVAYLLKPYFATLLEEAAKEHYPLIKAQYKKLAGKVHGLINRNSDSSNRKSEHSRYFSIYSTTADGTTMKFIFDENQSMEQWEMAAGMAFEILVRHHLENSSPDLAEDSLKEKRKTPHTVYLVFNENTEQWEFFDEMKFIRESREKKGK